MRSAELERWRARALTAAPRRTWRSIARPAIAAALEACGYHRGDCTLKEARAELRAAYPFGERKHWPYKVWCDEARRQLGLVQPPGFKPGPKCGPTDSGPLFAGVEPDRQCDLFLR